MIVDVYAEAKSDVRLLAAPLRLFSAEVIPHRDIKDFYTCQVSNFSPDRFSTLYDEMADGGLCTDGEPFQISEKESSEKAGVITLKGSGEAIHSALTSIPGIDTDSLKTLREQIPVVSVPDEGFVEIPDLAMLDFKPPGVR